MAASHVRSSPEPASTGNRDTVAQRRHPPRRLEPGPPGDQEAGAEGAPEPIFDSLVVEQCAQTGTFRQGDGPPPSNSPGGPCAHGPVGQGWQEPFHEEPQIHLGPSPCQRLKGTRQAEGMALGREIPRQDRTFRPEGLRRVGLGRTLDRDLQADAAGAGFGFHGEQEPGLFRKAQSGGGDPEFEAARM